MMTKSMRVLYAVALVSLYVAFGGQPTISVATRTNGQQDNSTRQTKKINLDQQCDGSPTLEAKVDKCAEPLMDLLAGRLSKWPRTDDDAMELCDSFGQAERCIKDASRKCARGIQKTIVSTIGSSVQRVRKRECNRAKSAGILKTTACIENHQKLSQDWMISVTARLSAIETQETVPEKKINAICCMVSDIEKEILDMLSPFCANEARFMQRIFRGVIDNAVDIVCRNPKCKDFMKQYNVSKGRDFDGLIETILKIVFSMDASE